MSAAPLGEPRPETAAALVGPNVLCPVLVGRDAPLSAARLALDRARDGRGTTLCVSGEAGVGKSRLVRALADDARARGFVVLRGACFEADRARPYAPVLDLVHALTAAGSRALAAHYFAPAAAELTALFPELRAVFADTEIGAGAARRTPADPEEDRRRLFQALGATIWALGGVQPLLLVVEDVHWSDDATLELLLHLARRLDAHRIALVLTFRSDEVGPRLARLLADLDRARCATDVALGPLGAPEVRAMLDAIFGARAAFALGPTFVDGLHALTEGNPFFVEETLKALIVAGDLAREDGAWRVRTIGPARVPRTAIEAVGRRLAGLSAGARDVASMAAVAGRRFDFELLRALTGRDAATVLSLVAELVDAQLVVEESADRFAFRHALTREAIRQRLLARERVALHRAIAAALATLYAARADDAEADAALAHHYFEAADWEPAHRHARRAATHALALCAPREALRHFDRAAEAAARAGRPPDAALLLARGRAHETLGMFREAHDDFTDALDAARARDDAPDASHTPGTRGAWEALHALGMLWAARDYERAGQYRRDALEAARAIGEPALVARSLNRVGNWLANRERPHAGIPLHEEALAIFERAGDTRGVAESADLLATAHHMAGDQTRAAALYARSVVLFAALDERRGMVSALAIGSMCGPSYHAAAGPVCARAPADGERAVRLASDIGWRAGEACARYLLADTLGWRGEYGRALRLARESLSIAEELEHREWQCGARRVLGFLALDLCAPAEALAHLGVAHELARQLGSAAWMRWTAAPLAIAWARASRPDEGARVLDAAERSRAPNESRADAPADAPADARDDAPRTLGERWLLLARAECALAAGDAAAALDAVARVDPGDGADVPWAALLRARALAARERWDDAAAALGRAGDGARRQGARGLLWRVLAAEGVARRRAGRRREARREVDAARAAALDLVAGVDEPSLVAAFRAGVDRAAPPVPAPSAARAAKVAAGGLTRRERETAALVARGHSNLEVARALGVGERTVETHVASALAKLAFTSRVQLAVWAAGRGLALPPASHARRA